MPAMNIGARIRRGLLIAEGSQDETAPADGCLSVTGPMSGWQAPKNGCHGRRSSEGKSKAC
jgi:hypothetical protein